MEIIKSPFNWIGNKNAILPQLIQIFPQKIDTLIDFFCGGCDIGINIPTNQTIAIDVNKYLMDILKEFQHHSLQEILDFIEKRITEFNLSKENEAGFLAYREAYNNNQDYHTPLDLYTLTRFSFHFTMRFNRDMKFNAGFGRAYSNFSARQRKAIVPFHERLQRLNLINVNFNDINLNNYDATSTFLYFDPPYLITNNVYNNGVESAWQHWDENNERELLSYILTAHNTGFKFALSNVLHTRGKTNTILLDWIKKNNFNMYTIDNKGYSHCTHTVPQDNSITQEIVVTNY